VGVIVPDVDGINLWCTESNMLLSAAEACRNVVIISLIKLLLIIHILTPFLSNIGQAFKKTVLNDILNIGKREGLQHFEQVLNFSFNY
jgi:hypothetical protein